MSKDKNVVGSPIVSENVTIPKAKHISLDANKLQQIEENIKQFEKEKDSLVSVFGIWATLIVFITFEFNFFKTFCLWQEIVGFSLIISGILLGFNIGLDLLSRVRSNSTISREHLLFYFFTVALLIAGCFFMYLGSNSMEKEKRHDEDYNTLKKKYAKLYENYNQKLQKKNAKPYKSSSS